MDEPYLRRSGLRYHNKVASWSKSYRFDSFNHVCNSGEYLFIEGDIDENYGFDVMKFCELMYPSSDILFRLRHEQEIIFPIDKKHVKSKEYMVCSEYINRKDSMCIN
ncbi:hypothetical protein [Clostridium tertium]|uniref:Uncharacterized protein n=1 Tax=Clostridium tertium TaxID=1559 RepID=A0A6N2Y636_9CLOT